MIQRPLTYRPVGFRPLRYRPDDLAGYKVLTRSTPGSADSLAAYTLPGDTDHTLTGLGDDSVRYAHIKAVTECGIEQPTGRLQRIAIDANGNLIAPVPNAPIGLRAVPTAGGKVEARWHHSDFHEPAKAAQFNVYHDNGTGTIDYSTPATTISNAQKRQFAAELGAFAGGTTIKLAVRAETSSGDEEKNTNTASATADATAPDQPGAFATEVLSE